MTSEAIFECSWCSKEIVLENAYFQICKNIEQLESDSEGDWGITVLRSDGMFVLCGRCGNSMDDEKLLEILKDKDSLQLKRPVV